MTGVLSGLSLIWAIIVLGWVLSRFGALPPESSEVLNRLVYFVGTPCIMFVTLVTMDVRAVFGPPLIVAGSSAVVTAILFVIFSRLRRLDRGSSVVGAMSSSLNNAGHLGIPLATYILGSPQFVLPVLVFQLAFFSPMFFVLSDLAGHSGPVSLGKIARTIVTNPMLIAAVTGITVNMAGISLPALLFAPIDVLAGLAVPVILIAFGLSLNSSQLVPSGGHASTVAFATMLKLVVHPLIAWVIARFVFGLDGLELFAAVSMAGLPTAQNAYVAAFRAGTGQDLARGAVLATTILVTPTLMLIAALLA